MLDRLPFPKHLQNVTEIAGGHHEKMDGTGYPKRLTREQMSLPARMMAIADIFEALTAVDRPYKKGKTLSEALNIMVGMCKGAHIDPQLFALFIRAGIYRRYAERFMQAEQIDQVDEQMVLEKAGVLYERALLAKRWSTLRLESRAAPAVRYQAMAWISQKLRRRLGTRRRVAIKPG